MVQRDSETLYTTEDVAKQLGISCETIVTYVKSGFITPDYVKERDSLGRSGGRLFKEETVEAFLSKCFTGRRLDEPLMSSGDVAIALGVDVKTVRRLCKHGRLRPDIVLPSSKAGRSGAFKFYVSTFKEFEKHYEKWSVYVGDRTSKHR